MRILHILDHSLPLHSGYAFRTLAILREQRALGLETLQVTTPRQQSAADFEDVEGWRFHRTALRGSPIDCVPFAAYLREMAATRRRVDELIETFRPDVLHAHSPVLNVLPALRAGRRHRVPVVYELRALWEDAAVDHGTTREGSARYRASRALESHALREADHITTICEGLRGEILARGIAPTSVTVIPNAVDTTVFRFGVQADATLRRELRLDGTTVLGFAGSFYGYEGIDLLIDAVARLVVRRPEVRVLLVGGGPQENALRSLVSDRGLADRVVFTGRVPHGDVQRYYEQIDLLVYPRRRMRLTELVTPLKPLEAMAQGRILIASDVGGHRELIRDGETGFLFEAGDVEALVRTIDRTLDARPSWPRIAANGRRFVETERSWKSSVSRYVQVYADLCAPASMSAVHA